MSRGWGLIPVHILPLCSCFYVSYVSGDWVYMGVAVCCGAGGIWHYSGLGRINVSKLKNLVVGQFSLLLRKYLSWFEALCSTKV